MIRRRKKLLLFLVGLFLVVSLTGCDIRSDGKSESSEPKEETGISEENGNITGKRTLTAEDTESSAYQEETEGDEEMNIRIKVGDQVLKATLYDNAAARQIYDSLPVTYPMMNLYGREMCYRMGAGSLPTDEAADTGYETGDISYWPPAGSLVILYKQNGEVFEQQPIGHTDDDMSFFDGLDDTDITWERDE